MNAVRSYTVWIRAAHFILILCHEKIFICRYQFEVAIKCCSQISKVYFNVGTKLLSSACERNLTGKLLQPIYRWITRISVSLDWWWVWRFGWNYCNAMWFCQMHRKSKHILSGENWSLVMVTGNFTSGRQLLHSYSKSLKKHLVIY